MKFASISSLLTLAIFSFQCVAHLGLGLNNSYPTESLSHVRPSYNADLHFDTRVDSSSQVTAGLSVFSNDIYNNASFLSVTGFGISGRYYLDFNDATGAGQGMVMGVRLGYLTYISGLNPDNGGIDFKLSFGYDWYTVASYGVLEIGLEAFMSYQSFEPLLSYGSVSISSFQYGIGLSFGLPLGIIFSVGPSSSSYNGSQNNGNDYDPYYNNGNSNGIVDGGGSISPYQDPNNGNSNGSIGGGNNGGSGGNNNGQPKENPKSSDGKVNPNGKNPEKTAPDPNSSGDGENGSDSGVKIRRR